jgi:hypothetical protein
MVGMCPLGIQEEEAEQARQEHAKKKRQEKKARQKKNRKSKPSGANEVCNPNDLIAAPSAWHCTR